MPTQLPKPVADYFRITGTTDLSELNQCFTDDAVVIDENQRHQGHQAIEAWITNAKAQYTFTVEILGSATHEAGITVHTNVAGDFPGSPVALDHAFQLSGDRITFLEITVCP